MIIMAAKAGSDMRQCEERQSLHKGEAGVDGWVTLTHGFYPEEVTFTKH